MPYETKKYFCTRPRVYSMLIEAGFRPVEILPHFTKPEYHVWAFIETEELKQLVDNYFSKIN